MEHIYIASLFLLHVSQEPLFYHPMCINLQHETQLKIKSFLEMIIPYGKKIITEVETDIPKTPVTLKKKFLRIFLILL